MPARRMTAPLLILVAIMVISTVAPALDAAARADFPVPAQPLTYAVHHTTNGPGGLTINTYTGSIAFQRTLMTLPMPESLIAVGFDYASDDPGDGRFAQGWSFGLSYTAVMTTDGVLQVKVPDGSLRAYYRAAGHSPDETHYTVAGDVYRIVDHRGLIVTFGETGSTDSRPATRVETPQGLAVDLVYRDGNLRRIEAPGLLDGAATLYYDLQGRLARIVDFEGGTWAYAYDDEGRITRIDDPDGGSFALSYDYWRLTQVTGPRDAFAIVYGETAEDSAAATEDGTTRLLTYTLDGETFTALHSYDAQGRILSAENHQGEFLFYDWDSQGRLRSYHTGDGTGETYTYDEAGNIIRVVDARGGTTRYSYSEQGNLLYRVDALGEVIRYSYDNAGNVTHIVDALGNETRFNYDGDGNLLTQTDALGSVTRFTYDEDGNKLSETTPLGHTTTFTYDIYGQMLTRTGPDGGILRQAYDDLGRRVSLIDPMGGETTFAYDSAGRMIRTVDPMGGVTVTRYTAYGQVASETNARGYTIRYAYDDFGRLVAQRSGDRVLATYTYDPYGSLLVETDGAGYATTYAYAYTPDPIVVAETDGAGNTTTYTADSAGNVTSKTGPAGHVSTYAYDALNRLLTSTDALGGVTTHTYDANGNLTSMTDVRGVTTTYEYDALDRMARTVVPGVGTLENTYDAMGRIVAVVDPAGDRSEMVYDAAGNVVRLIMADGSEEAHVYDLNGNRVASIGVLGGETTFTYDANGNLLSETNPLGHTTTYGYDALGQRTSITDARGYTTTTAYDIYGNAVRVTDGEGHTTTRAYDGRGLLVMTTYPDGAITRSDYDGAGNIVRFTDEDGGVTAFTYDPRGLPLTVTDPRGFVTTYTYDAMGSLTSVTDGTGATSTFTLDAAGNITAQTDALGRTTVYTLDAQGRVVERTDPDGAVRQMAYDTDGNLAASTDPNGNTSTFTYDLDGRLLSSTDALGATTTRTYDAAGNLLSLTDALGGTVTFVYDVVGNLLSETDALGHTTTYTYNATGNLLTVTDALGGTVTLTYDGNGRVLSETNALGSVTASTYDSRGRLLVQTDPMGDTLTYAYTPGGDVASITDGSGAVTRFTYNAGGNLAAMTDPNGHTTTYTYDANGNLLTETRPDGAVITNVYDAAGQLIAVIDALGNTASFTYDEAGRRIEVTDAGGGVTRTAYDAAGNIVSLTNPLGATTTTTFDAAGNPLTIANDDGAATTYVYDLLGRLIEERTADGRSSTYTYDANGSLIARADLDGGLWQLTYDALGRRTAVIDPEGHTRRTAYDAAGNIVRETNARGFTTIYTYDARGNIASMTDARGFTTRYATDQAGRLTWMRDPLGGETTLVYDGAGNLLTETGPQGATIAFTYDAMGRRTSRTDAGGFVTAYTYDLNGNLTSETDPLGATTTYAYDAMGRRLSVTDANGFTVTDTYDLVGNRTSRTDGDGHTTTTTYDAYGRQLSETDPLGAVTTTTYDAAGNIATVTDPNGGVTTYSYDVFGNTTAITDPNGHTTTYTYDRDGNLLMETDPMGFSVTYTLDPAGNVLSATGPDGATTRYGYDANGNMVSERDALGVVTRYAYDALGRMVSVTDDATGIDGDPAITRYAYDAAGNRTRVTNALGQTTTLEYDVRGFLIAETAPDGATTSYRYDAAGNLTTLTTPDGATTTYAYDAEHQITVTGYADGSATHYAYDGRGNLVLEASAEVRVARWYDPADRLALVGVATADFVQMLSFGYDAVGNRVTQHVHGEGVLSYAYDAAGNVTAVTGLDGATTTFSYDANAQITEQVNANGSRSTFSYLPDGTMAGFTHRAADGSVIAAGAYTFDERGQRTSITDETGAATTFAYDAQGRLIEAVYGDGSREAFTYDAAGNRSSHTTTDGATITYTYDEAGRLLAAGDSRYTYDGAGQRITETGTAEVAYSYDAAGRMVEHTTGTGTVERYAYYDDGSRLSVTDAEGHTVYTVYDPLSDNALLELDADGVVIASYVAGERADDLISVTRDGMTHVYHQDALNSVVALTNTNGALVSRTHYRAFGQIAAVHGEAESRFSYTGREHVGGSLYYYRLRFYDATTGLFTALDPLPASPDDPASFNSYVYVQHDPANFTDPYGLINWNPTSWGEALVDALGSAWKGAEKIAKDTYKKGNRYAKKIGGEFIEMSAEAYKVISDLGKDSWHNARKIGKDLYKKGSRIAKKIGNRFVEMAESTYDAVYVASQQAGNFLYGATQDMLDDVAKMGDRAFREASSAFDAAMSAAGDLAGDIADAVEDGFNAALPVLDSITSQIGTIIETAMGPIVDGLGMMIDVAFDALDFIIGPIMEQIIKPIINATVKPAVKHTLKPAADLALQPVDDEIEKIKATQDALYGGITDMIKDGGTSLQEKYDALNKAVLKDTLGKVVEIMAGPGSVAAQIADNSSSNILAAVFAPIVDGIIKPFFSRLDSLTDTILDPFITAIEPLTDRINSTLEGLIEILNPLEEYVLGPLGDERDAMMEKIRREYLQPIFRPIIQLHREIPGFGEFFMMLEEEYCGNNVRDGAADDKGDTVEEVIKDAGGKVRGSTWTVNIFEIAKGLGKGGKCRKEAMLATFCLASELAGPFELDDLEPSQRIRETDDGSQLLWQGAELIARDSDMRLVEVNETVDGSFRVRVVDRHGDPYEGANIVFSAPLGGASGTFEGSGSPFERVLTDHRGWATSSPFTANSIAGEYDVRVQLDANVRGFRIMGRWVQWIRSAMNLGLEINYPVTNTPDAPMLITTGDESFIGVVNQPPDEGTLSVAVRDIWGNPYEDVPVTFTAPEGDVASVNLGGARTFVVLTDEDGVATVTDLRLSTVSGEYTITAALLDPPEFTLDERDVEDDLEETFNFENIPDVPADILILSGTDQQARVYHPFASPLALQVVDQFGNGTPGRPLVVRVPFNGPAAHINTSTGSSTLVLTGEEGFTDIGLTANAFPGAYAVNLSMPAFALSETINLENLHGIPAIISARGGGNQATQIENLFPLPLTVRVYDAEERPLFDIPVSFSGPASGPGMAFVSGSTGAEATTTTTGSAQSPMMLANATVGTYSVTATAGDVSTTLPLENLVGAPNRLANVSGGDQTTVVATTYDEALTVCVTDNGGNPTSGQLVLLEAPDEGASGTFAQTGMRTAWGRTGDNGCFTSTAYTANTISGTYWVTANVNGVYAVYTLTNLPDAPAILEQPVASSYNTRVNTAYPLPLDLVVRDQYGNPVPDTNVTFNVNEQDGAGAIFDDNDAQALTVTSDVAGQVMPHLTANTTSGGFTVEASVTVAATGDVLTATFNLTNNPGVVDTLVLWSGDGQSTEVSRSFGQGLAVRALDEFGNAVPRQRITFAAPNSSTTAHFDNGLTSQTIVTDANGVAISSVPRASTAAGAYTVTASFNGLYPVAFALENAGGGANQIIVISGSPAPATVGGGFPQVSVEVRDRFGNLIGADVTFSTPSSLEDVPSARFNSNSSNVLTVYATDGYASSGPLTANTRAGAYSLIVQVTGAPARVISLTNTPGAVDELRVMNGSDQAAEVGGDFPLPFTVVALDANDNPVPGANVTFTAPGSGASGSFNGGSASVLAITDANGYATSPTFTANGVGSPGISDADDYHVVASANGRTVDFPLVNYVQPSLVIEGGSIQTATVGTAFANPLRVRLLDEFGQPVDGVQVTFSSPQARFNGGGAQTVTTAAGGYAESVHPVAGGAASDSYTAEARAQFSGIIISRAVTASFTLSNAGSTALTVTPVDADLSATVRTAFSGAEAIRFNVRDTNGDRVQVNAVLQVTPVAGSGGLFTNGQQTLTITTNPTGDTVISDFTANGRAGSYTVTITAAGSSATLNLTNRAGQPAAIQALSGYDNAAPVNTAFDAGAPLAVLVRDAEGNAVANYPVTFTAPGTGSSATLAAVSANTDTSGIARMTLTANTIAGGYTVSASANGLEAVFALTNTPAPVANLVILSGDGQSATVGTAYANRLRVQVVDGEGNGVPGVSVDFSDTVGPASLSDVSDEQGIAEVVYTAPTTATAGYTVTASTTAGSAPSIAFSLDATAGAPAAVSITGTNTYAAGQTVDPGISVTVQDAQGNDLPDATVILTATAGRFGGAAQITLTTDATGTARAGLFTARTSTGNAAITATAGGVSDTLNVTINPGLPAAISVTNGSGQSVRIQGQFPTYLKATVTDAFGNAIVGQGVTFTAPASGPSASFSGSRQITATTVAGGIVEAAVRADAGTIAGTYSIIASVDGYPGVTIAFTLTNQPGLPHTISVVEGSNQQTAVQMSFSRMVRVRVTDAGGNTVADGTNVIFSTNANLTLSSHSTVTSSGIALVTVSAKDTTGTFSFTASAGSATRTVGGLEVTIGEPHSIVVLSGDNGGAGQTAEAGARFGEDFHIRVTDTHGNGVADVPVEFTRTVTATGATAELGSGRVGRITLLTNASGEITLPMWANGNGDTANTYTVTATVLRDGVTASASVTLMNDYLPPYQLVAVSGGMEATVRRGNTPEPITFRYEDNSGQGIVGSEVAVVVYRANGWEVVQASQTFTTDSNGEFVFAPAAVAANYPDDTLHIVANAGVTLEVVIDVLAGTEAAIIEVVHGNDQLVGMDMYFSTDLQVRVLDVTGAPIPNAVVYFQSDSGSCDIELFNFEHRYDSYYGYVRTDSEGYTSPVPARSRDQLCTGSVTATSGTATATIHSLRVQSVTTAQIRNGLSDIRNNEVGTNLATFDISMTVGTETRDIEAEVYIIDGTNGAGAYFNGNPGLTSIREWSFQDGGSSTFRLEIGSGMDNWITSNGIPGTWTLGIRCVKYKHTDYANHLCGDVDEYTITNTLPTMVDGITWTGMSTQTVVGEYAANTGTICLTYGGVPAEPRKMYIDGPAPIDGQMLAFPDGNHYVAIYPVYDPDNRGCFSNIPVWQAVNDWGSYTVRVSDDFMVTTSVTFTNTPPPGVATLEITAGNNQQVNTGATVAPMRVRALDAAGDPVEGVDITFHGPDSGPGFNGASSRTDATDASGIAQALPMVNNIAGRYEVVARAPSGVEVTFNIENVAPAPTLERVSPAAQTTTAGTDFASPLRVRVMHGGQPVMNPDPATLQVAWAASGGLTLSAATSNIDAGGYAQVTANSSVAAGSYTVTATAGSASTTFDLTILPGAPATLNVASGNNQTPTVHTTFGQPLCVRLSDSGGNNIADMPVTFSAPTSGASLLSATTYATTDANGRACITPDSNTVAGSYNVTASYPGVTAATFNVTNRAAAPAAMSVVQGGGQAVVVNATVSPQLCVVVVDTYGNGVNNTNVTFTSPPSSGAGFRNTPTRTDASDATGRSCVSPAVSHTTGAYVVTATVDSDPAISATLALSNIAGPVDAVILTASSFEATADHSFPRVTATAVDAYGNVVEGVNLRFAVSDTNRATIGGAAAANVVSAEDGTASVQIDAGTEAGTVTLTVTSTDLVGLNETRTLTVLPDAPTQIELTRGDNQTTPVGTLYTNPLCVRLRDTHGNTVNGINVTFTAAAEPVTGASITQPVLTDPTSGEGVACVTPTANTSPGGPYSITAAAMEGTLSVTFTEANSVGAPAQLILLAGDSQHAEVGTAFTDSLTVEVHDSYGNLVPGANVVFTAPATGATGTFGVDQQTTVTTGADGQAAASLTAGTVTGTYSVTATVNGLSASFTAENTPGAAVSVTAEQGGGQSAVVDAAFVLPLHFRVTDAEGNPVADGTAVTFSVGGAGLAGVPASATTIDGVVSFTTTAGTVAGESTVTATANGATASLTLTTTAGAPASLTAISGGGQQAVIDANFGNLLVVEARDSYGNPVPDVNVTFNAQGGTAGGHFGGPGASSPAVYTFTTGSNGRVNAQLTADMRAGAYTVIAQVGALSASFSMTNLPGAPAAITITGGDGQTAMVGTTYGSGLAVRVTDAGGNPVPNATVVFTVNTTPDTGSASFGGLASITLTTDASGQAATGAPTANAEAGSFTVTATAGGLTVDFVLTNLGETPPETTPEPAP